MIIVDRCRPCGAPWRGGVACHLLSDDSEAELLEFAAGVGIPMQWYQARASVPHFDLTPGWRARAVRAGAVTVERHGIAAGMQRWRERNRS